MNYWIVVFNEDTWQQFRSFDRKRAGFSRYREKVAAKIALGDTFLFYLSGWSRFIGFAKAQGTASNPQVPAFSAFPVEVPVDVQLALDPEQGIPLHPLLDRFLFNRNNPNGWRYYVRQSPNRWPAADAEMVIGELVKAGASPVRRERPRRRPYHSLR